LGNAAPEFSKVWVVLHQSKIRVTSSIFSSLIRDIQGCEQALLATCLHAGFFLSLFFDPEDGGDMLLQSVLTFGGLFSVISQNTELFITTAMRTSNDAILLHNTVEGLFPSLPPLLLPHPISPKMSLKR
jgi:hypothetical protein